MNGYVCFWNGKRCEVYAETMYAAKLKAVAKFKGMAGRKRVHSHLVAVCLAEKNGEEVIHNPID